MMCSIDCSDPAIIAAFVSGVFAAASGIVTLGVYNRKKKIEAKMYIELAEHKDKLDDKAREIQSVLNIQLEKIRIQYGSLYAERLVVIKEIHSRLTKLNIYIQTIKKVASGGIDPNKIDKTGMDDNFDLQKFIGEYTLYVNNNKLYLSKKLYTVLSAAPLLATLDVLKGATKESITQALTSQGKSSEDIATANTAKQKLNADLPELDTNEMLEVIEDEFRKLIGIEE